MLPTSALETECAESEWRLAAKKAGSLGGMKANYPELLLDATKGSQLAVMMARRMAYALDS